MGSPTEIYATFVMTVVAEEVSRVRGALSHFDLSTVRWVYGVRHIRPL